MNGILKLRDNTDYQLRQTSQPLADSFHSVSNCSELASYLRPKIWEQIAFKIKHVSSLDVFKTEMWKPVNCPCRTCKVFIPKSSFI